MSKFLKQLRVKGPFIGDYAVPKMSRGPFIGDYAKPRPMGRLMSRRFYSNYVPHDYSSSIKNGYADINTFESMSKLGKVYLQELPNFFGALLTVSTIMLVWPATVRGASNFFDDVPRDKGAQVHLKNFGLFGDEPVVDIPQTYAQLSPKLVAIDE
ncbi:uncharacterized protein RJT21DRAFT_121528 [Scheffersomyces amazonensis]|uniref:uncharacterized protein n=1 Tax=Scheffersomyces amazonensis TaxID=1078765 RepID=UPI00315C6528